jgi:hypothetical protein
MRGERRNKRIQEVKERFCKGGDKRDLKQGVRGKEKMDKKSWVL